MSLRILTAITNAMARVRRIHDVRAEQLGRLLDPALVPLRFLAELAEDHGFDATLEVTSHINALPGAEAVWRRLLDVARRDVWDTKGTHECARLLVRALTGARSSLLDWHSLGTFGALLTATTVGSRMILPWVGTAGIADAGQYRTQVHVEDFDGALDRDLVEKALKAVRPWDERWDVTFVHMVENWRDGLFGRWSDAGTVADTDNVLALGPDASNASEVVLTSGTPSGWTHAQFVAVCQWGSAGAELRFGFRRASASALYELRMTQGVSSPNVALYRSGVSVATATHGIPLDAAVIVQVLTFPLASGSLEIQVWIDGVLDITYTDSSPLSAGAVSWTVPASGGDASVQWFEVLPGNAETRTME